MNHKQLEALIYVSRCGTFKQAAEALYFESSGEEFITPESMQYRIKQLEQELGVSLYRKRQGSARVLLTREGQLFLPEALEIYQRMADWKGMFLETGKGTLTISTTQAILIHRLAETVAEYRNAQPDVRLRMVNAPAPSTEGLVAQGQVDLGLSTRPPEQAGLEYVLWKQSRMILVAPAGLALAKRRSATLAEIAEHPLLLLEPEIRGDRELVDEAFRKAGIKRPSIVLEASNSEILLAYVEQGIGVSVMAETSMIRQRRRVVAVPISDPIGRTEVGLLVREGQYLPMRVRAFLKLLDPMFEQWLAERDEKLEHEGNDGPAVKIPKKDKAR